MKLGRDGISGLIALAVSLVLLAQSFRLPSLPLVPVGPGFYPKIVLAFMALASLLLIVQDVAAQRRSAAARGAVASTPRRSGLVAASFAVVAAYVVMLPYLGFRIATLLFLAAFQYLLERPGSLRQWLVLAAISIGATLIGYLVFEQYLHVLLPRGRWTGM